MIVAPDQTEWHTASVGLLWMGDRPAIEAFTCTTHHIHKKQMSMLPAGSEPAIPGSKRPLTDALEFNFLLSSIFLSLLHICLKVYTYW
jgi:hypothetical protein